MSKTSTKILSISPTYCRCPGHSDDATYEAVISYIDLVGSIKEVTVYFLMPDGIENAAMKDGIVSCCYCGEYCEPVLWEKGKLRDYGICHDCVFDPEARDWWLNYFENPDRSNRAVWWASRHVMLRFFGFILEAE